MPDDDLLTPREAGHQLRCTPRYVRLLCNLGQLRYVARGGPVQPRYLIPQSAIDEWKRIHTRARTA